MRDRRAHISSEQNASQAGASSSCKEMSMEPTLTILHFNDVYEAEPSKAGPGAARFVAKLRQLGASSRTGADFEERTTADTPTATPPLVLFSGDALNPSLMSTCTKGEHMVEVLNACGVHAACVGNHDLDFGCGHFRSMARKSSFPWLCSNASHKDEAGGGGDGGDGDAEQDEDPSEGDGKLGLHPDAAVPSRTPLGGCDPSCVLQHGGWRIGVLGLIEEDWLSACSTLDPAAIAYEDLVECARREARWLRHVERCDLVIALTHCRLHNDLRLAEACSRDAGAERADIDIILGGHDHDAFRRRWRRAGESPSHDSDGCWVVKSGTDFRELSRVVVGRVGGTEGDEVAKGGEPVTSSVLVKSVERVEVGGEDDSTLEPDAAIAAMVGRYAKQLAKSMDTVLGRCVVPLEGRFSHVRTCETNLGNWVADVTRNGCQADIAIITGGTLRADRVFDVGDLTARDVCSILPFLDQLVVVTLSGAQVLEALENGVSKFPVLDGRFPQVSGLSFAFDPRRAPGHRVIRSSVRVRSTVRAAAAKALQLRAGASTPTGTATEEEQLLSEDDLYSVAVTEFVAKGKEGYDVFRAGEVFWDAEQCPLLPTLVRNHLSGLNNTDNLHGGSGSGAAARDGWSSSGAWAAAADAAAALDDTPQASASNALRSLLRRQSRSLASSPEPRGELKRIAEAVDEAGDELSPDKAQSSGAGKAADGMGELCTPSTPPPQPPTLLRSTSGNSLDKQRPLPVAAPAVVQGLRRVISSPQLLPTSLAHSVGAAMKPGNPGSGNTALCRASAVATNTTDSPHCGDGGGSSVRVSDRPSVLAQIVDAARTMESADRNDGPARTNPVTRASVGAVVVGDASIADSTSDEDVPLPPPQSLRRVRSLPSTTYGIQALRSPLNRQHRRGQQVIIQPRLEGRIINIEGQSGEKE